MTNVLECATVNESKAVPDLGVTTPSKPSGVDGDAMLHVKKLQRLGPPTAKSRLVPIPKNGIKSPKRYAANGVRMSPVIGPLHHNNRGRRRKLNAGHEGLPIEAYTASFYETPSILGFPQKLNLQVPDFSPGFAPLSSPKGMNPSAPEFSPSGTCLGKSPLAKPYTRVAVDIGLSPLAAPFVPSSIPEQMPSMDLGQSLRSALHSIINRSNPACFEVNEQLYEIYDVKTF